jgi:predicted Ser/Thr protein kinase
LERRLSESRESTDGGRQLLLGKKLLERGIITPDQLREALADRARSMTEGSAKPLGSILVAKGYLSDSQLFQLLEEQATRPPTSSAGDVPGFMAAAPEGASVTLPAPSTASATLTRLGKYELVRELGRGGMGVVYEAVDTQLGRKVALKLMLTNPNQDPKEASVDEERFVQEAQLSAKLKHPNIVTVYEAGILEGRRFLAMELIEGSSLVDWRKDVSLKQQVALLRDVSQAVHHAHEQGILHRDLKPRNVLVAADGHAYVTDFGLAKSLGSGKAHHSLTGSGAVVGTPAYMSPEQAQGNERVDWRTDIYSLGVILYEMLTGRTPFTGESPIEILMKVVKDPVPPPSSVAEGAASFGIDKAIENICLKATAKKDRDRYVTAKAFAEDLDRWIKGEQVKTVAPKVRRPKKSKAGFLIGGAAGLVAAGAIAAWLLFFGGLSSKPDVTQELAQARAAMERGEYRLAQGLFDAVLSRDAANAEAADGAQRAREAADQKDAQDRASQTALANQLKAAQDQLQNAIRLAREKLKGIDEATLTEEDRERLLAQRRELEAEIERHEARVRELGDKVKKPEDGPEVSRPEADPWKGALNLLSQFDAQRGVIWGTWAYQSERLLSDRESRARIEVPFKAPEEYDLRLQFQRRSGVDAVALLVPLPKGGVCAWEIGASGNTAAQLATLPPTPEGRNPSSFAAPMILENDRVYVAEVQVRRDGMALLLDGKPLARWKGDWGTLSAAADWKLRSPEAVGLGSHESPTEFQRLDFLPRSGDGRRPLPSPPTVLRAVPLEGSSLRPGLIAEYFHGTNFEVAALRRVDPVPGGQWNEGPAWENGPVDGFSARWSGLIYVPRTGRYTFTVSADDGVRLIVDDVQVFSQWSGGAETERSAVVPLQIGHHRVRVEYHERIYMAAMTLSWAEGSAPSMPMAKGSFYHVAAEANPLPASRVPELLAVLPDRVVRVAFSADGRSLVTADDDRRIRLWDPAARRETSFIAGHPAPLLGLACSPDGKRYATAGRDGRVRFWDAQAGSEAGSLDAHQGPVTAVLYTADGRRLASAGADRRIRLWDLESMKPLRDFTGHRSGVEGIAFGPGAKLIASCGHDRTVRIWDVETGKTLHVLSGHPDGVQAVAFSPDGALVASAGSEGRVRIWDVQEGREARALPGHTGETHSVVFSPDGRLLASGGSDCIVRIWDPQTGKELKRLPGHTDRVLDLVFSKEGRLLVSAGFDQALRLWDLRVP